MCIQNKICMPKKNCDAALKYMGFQCLEGKKSKQKNQQNTNLPWGIARNGFGPEVTVYSTRADSWEPGNFDRISGK